MKRRANSKQHADCTDDLAKVSAEETQKLTGKPFGFYWWLDLERGLVMMCGHGGQYVLINRSRSLLVVFTAEPYTQGGHSFPLDSALDIYDKVLRSLRW